MSDEGDESVSVPTDGINEPQFRHDGKRYDKDIVIPGNKEFTPGDLINKPQSGGSGSGKKASDGDEISDDEFEFLISADEYHEMLFEDLELHNLRKTSINKIIHKETKRAGFVTDGTPNNLDLVRSMRKSLSRRIALKTPKMRRIKELEEERALLAAGTPTISSGKRIIEIDEEISALRIRMNAVGFIDPIDLRYRNYNVVAKPNYQAVMFCVMDVSGSVTETEKELSKRFYLLLYLFLKMKYKTVDVIFIRHHTIAKECDEDEFFHSRETGGTVVSSAFNLMHEIQKERYPENDWNIYVAQASDGDNFTNDNVPLMTVLEASILPVVQYFAYVEVGEDSVSHSLSCLGGTSTPESTLWAVYKQIAEKYFQMRKIRNAAEVFPVFHNLFSKERADD
jgi:hypothetical protein